MAHAAEEYRAVDVAVGAQIKAELHAHGCTSYPAVCDLCHGAGKHADGEKCDNCGGAGSYELAV